MLLVRPLARNGHCRGLRSVNACEHKRWYLPGGLLLILGKNRHLFGLAVEQPLAFLTSRYRRSDPKAFAAQFDCRHRVGH